MTRYMTSSFSSTGFLWRWRWKRIHIQGAKVHSAVWDFSEAPQALFRQVWPRECQDHSGLWQGAGVTFSKLIWVWNIEISNCIYNKYLIVKRMAFRKGMVTQQAKLHADCLSPEWHLTKLVAKKAHFSKCILCFSKSLGILWLSDWDKISGVSTGESKGPRLQVCLHPGDPCHTSSRWQGVGGPQNWLWEEPQYPALCVWDPIHSVGQEAGRGGGAV